MFKNQVTMMGFALLLFMSFSKSDQIEKHKFKRNKGASLKTSNHKFLTKGACRTAIQCAVECSVTERCVLVDLQTGGLYRGGEGKTTPRVFTHYLVVSMDKGNKIVPKRKGTTWFLKVEDGGEVFNISMSPIATQKTGITLKGSVRFVVYEHARNTLYWCGKGGVFSKVMNVKSSEKKISKSSSSDKLTMYKNNLFLVAKRRAYYCVYRYRTGIKRYEMWHKIGRKPCHDLTSHGTMICWNQRAMLAGLLECFGITTKRQVLRYPDIRWMRGFSFITTNGDPYFAWTERNEDDRYSFKVAQFDSKSKIVCKSTVSEFKYPGLTYIVGDLLFYTVEHSSEVKAKQIGKKCRVGKTVFSTVSNKTSSGVKPLLAFP